MEPLYKGQVGDLLYSRASLQGTSWRLVLCHYKVEPLYKGQVGDRYRLSEVILFSGTTACPLFRGYRGFFIRSSTVLTAAGVLP